MLASQSVVVAAKGGDVHRIHDRQRNKRLPLCLGHATLTQRLGYGGLVRPLVRLLHMQMVGLHVAERAS